IPSLEVSAYLLQRLVRRSPRSEPIRAIQEIRFKDRLQDQQGRHLHYPVAYRRDSQRPQFPIRLRYVDASYGLRPVGLGAQRFPQLLQEPFRSEEHTSELQSRPHLVCRLLLEKKKHVIGVIAREFI